MKVLVLGATGFIGLPVAQAFVRAGHQVYGQTRSDDKAQQLMSDEIVAIVCEPHQTDRWIKTALEMDVVIDCVGGGDIATLGLDMYTAYQHAIGKQAHHHTDRWPTYIYTSGLWVHSQGIDTWASERTPKYGIKLTAWREKVEEAVLTVHDKNGVDGIVIRPGILYGKSGSLTALYFAQATDAAKKGESFAVPGDARSRMTTIHCDDLAEMYVLAAEKSWCAKFQTFVASNDATESLSDFLDMVTRLTGAPGWHYRKPQNGERARTLNALWLTLLVDFETALSSTTLIRPHHAKALLGWQPRKASLCDGIDVYYAAWKASQ